MLYVPTTVTKKTYLYHKRLIKSVL